MAAPAASAAHGRCHHTLMHINITKIYHCEARCHPARARAHGQAAGRIELAGHLVAS